MNFVDEIIKEYRNNKTIDDIMSEFNMEEKDIRAILKEHKIDRNLVRFSNELSNRIIELYLKGNKQKDIVNTLLVSDQGIRNVLTRNGIERRSYSDNNRKYYRNQKYFDHIDTSNKAYILGLLYADGCNHIQHHSITIALQERDSDLLYKIKEELEYEGPLRKNHLHSKNPRYQDQSVLCINDQYLSGRLNELGVINNKSLLLTFPDFIDCNLVRDFVRGYFDGDGTVAYDNKRSKCSTSVVGTYEFCSRLSEILLSIGCKNHMYHPKQSGDSNTYILQTCGNKSSSIFLSWMYKDSELKLERKYQAYIDFINKYTNKNLN